MAPIGVPDFPDGEVGGGEDVGGLDPLALLGALTQVAARTTPRAAVERLGALGAEWARIAMGRSEVRPEPRDWRFTNRAWSEHPMFRRMGQSYLAWADTVMQLVDDADVDWRTKERARFAATLITSASSPTNGLLLNPDAIERAWETAGRSVWRGLQNVARDARDNHGMPRSVDRSAFTVGKDLAATPGAVVHVSEALELLQYYPTTATVQSRPVVVVPPQINKYYVMDLAPGRSFVEYAVAQGFLVFVVSWRDVTAAQRDWGLDVYVDALADALRTAATIAKADDTAVVGVCAGGLTTAALLGLLAARGESLIPAAAFGVTHLDYSVPSTLGMLGTPEIVSRATRSSERSGVIDRRALSAMFALLRPNDLVWNYWVRNNLLGEAPPAFDVLAWNADSTCLPARLHEDFLHIFLNNTLARGDLSVQGLPVDLAKTDCDVMFMGARTDHLVPWKACYASAELFGGSREFVLSSSGHIQSLVNPPGSPKMSISFGDQAGLDVDEWLATATHAPGVWWERWAAWQKARSGPDRRAPSHLGDRAHPPTVPAPGRYVLGA